MGGRSAQEVSNASYDGSVLAAVLSPAVALVAALYALYLERLSDMLVLLAASASSLARCPWVSDSASGR